jgi:transcriptional regulator with XRE-family HTH domain
MDATVTVQEAARQLRSYLGLSQQAMATSLFLSMGAVRNYEAGSVSAPEARPLYAYLLCAEQAKRPQLAAVFRAELYRALGVPRDEWSGLGSIEPLDNFERLLVATLLATLRGEGSLQSFRTAVFEALEEPAGIVSRKLGLFRVWKTLSAKTVTEWAQVNQKRNVSPRSEK